MVFGQQQGLFADTATQHIRVCLDTDRVPNGAEFVMSAFRRCFQAVCGHVGFNIAEIPVGQHIGQVYPPTIRQQRCRIMAKLHSAFLMGDIHEDQDFF